MAFDFKKEYKELYLPKGRPEILTVPPMHYITVSGQGDPNEAGGLYQQAIQLLYAVAYTLKMSPKAGYQMEGFFDYVVPPLEGFWSQREGRAIDYANKAAFHWVSAIRLPDFVTQEHLEWAKETAARKKKLDCSPVTFRRVEEGLCVQMMHLGPFDTEPQTVAAMDAFLQAEGYENDCSDARWHHEIYLSDPRKAAPEKWRTVIRHPIKPAGDAAGSRG